AQAKLRIDERSSLYTFVALGNFIIGLLLTSFFVAVLKWGIAGVIWAQLINAVIFFMIYFATIAKDIRFTCSWLELKDMLEFGLPLIPGSIATSILMLSNRYFLKHLGNVADVGLFSAAFRIAQVIALIVNAVQMAWPTLLFSIVKDENAPRTYSKLLTYFVFVLVTMSLGLSIFAREILTLVTSETYLGAQYLIPLLSLANLFWGVFYMTSIGIQIEKKTIYVPLITGLAAVTNLGLNYWLIAMPRFSLWGAALASLSSHLVMALAAMGISLHFYYVPYEYRKLLQLFGYACILYLVGIWLPLPNIWLSLTVKGGLMVLFLVVLYFSRFFTVNEIEKMRQLLSTAGNRLTRLRTDGQV
ncbi:oligosaccharide flippase family protein, partial [candidate division KSB1 bacterium]|nr:oligosaccharide flippase family protein [candidate division KSB1 bacterium]